MDAMVILAVVLIAMNGISICHPENRVRWINVAGVLACVGVVISRLA